MLNFQAQFDASELITQREIVSQKVSEDLTERSSQFGIILDDISLVSSYCLKQFFFYLTYYMDKGSLFR